MVVPHSYSRPTDGAGQSKGPVLPLERVARGQCSFTLSQPHPYRLLGTAAMAAIRDKRSYLAAFYRRIAARRGGKRALVAVMHKLVIAIWHVLHNRQPYQDLGADYFARRNPEHTLRRMINQANSLGFTVRFDPIPAALTA